MLITPGLILWGEIPGSTRLARSTRVVVEWEIVGHLSYYDLSTGLPTCFVEFPSNWTSHKFSLHLRLSEVEYMKICQTFDEEEGTRLAKRFSSKLLRMLGTIIYRAGTFSA